MNDPVNDRRYTYLRERFGREAYQNLKLFWWAALMLCIALALLYQWLSDAPI